MKDTYPAYVVLKTKKLKPFIKWVGGKTHLLNVLDIIKPKNFSNYYEPFLGGGSVLLHLHPKNAFVSDINTDLILSWKKIKTNYKDVIKILKDYLAVDDVESMYYKLRNDNLNKYEDVQKVARFIFLNKTCFNGLYRVNRMGKFNVPFNKKKEISLNTLVDIKNIENVSFFLKKNNINISNVPYEECIKKANVGDFIFVDPPYDSDTHSFDSYDAVSFGKDGQKKLCSLLKEAHNKGVKWILTNHDTELINSLYQEFSIYKIPVNRFINSNGDKRKNATHETLIVNYKLSEYQEQELSNEIFFRELHSTSYFLKEYVNWNAVNNFIKNNASFIKSLNSLFSKKEEDFLNKFKVIFNEKKECFSLLPYLIAHNFKKEEFIFLNKEKKEVALDILNENSVLYFIRESGLLNNLFLNPDYKDVKTFLFGIYIGLSSHGRKNISGRFLPNLIEKKLTDSNISFKKEVSLSDIFKEHSLKEDKKFDFVFTIKNITYLLECSFFNVSGSKINSELSRMIAFSRVIDKFKNYQFIYVIDGIGLKKNTKKVIEALKEIKHLYNIQRFEKFIKKAP